MPRIIRVAHRCKPYAVIDRRLLEDQRLGWAARGLLGYLLAKPDDWQLRVSDLCRRGDLGRDGIRRVLQQLQDHGYVRREQVRDARGRVVGLDYTVLEVPESPGPDLPGPAVPDPERPAPVEPEPADPPLLSTKKTKYPIRQITTTTTACRRSDMPSARNRHGITEKGAGGNGDNEVEEEPRRHHRLPDNGKLAGRGGQADHPALTHPAALSAPEIAEAERKLAGLPVELAQQLLDELAGRMATAQIRGSALSYLRGLIARAEQGTFTPECAVTVAADREQRRRSEAALERAHRMPDYPPPNTDCRLVQRVLRLQELAQAKQRERELESKP